MKPPLLYSSRTIGAGRSGAAIELSPRALGWRTIHFAVRQLAPSSTWRGLSKREERCLVLLRGAFAMECGGRVFQVGPRADVFAAYPHAVYVPPGAPFRVRALEACEIADCRATV